MEEKDKFGIANDPLAITMIPPEEGKQHLGNYGVVSSLLSGFSKEVLSSYDKFLHGEEEGEPVQAEIEGIIGRYGDILMGRDDGYSLAPWQRTLGAKMRAWYDIKTDEDPGKGYFSFLAQQCMYAAQALADGEDESKVGKHLQEIMVDGVDRIIGVIQ